MASLGWLSLAGACYLRLPLFRAIWLGYWLLIVALWAWVFLWTFLTVMTYLSRKAYARATGALLVAVIVGALLSVPKWENAFIDSLFLLQRDRFDALATAYRNGEPLPVPWWMSLLSIDGRVGAQEHALYLPVYEDWRAETGVGIAYVPLPLDADDWIVTAAGDMGRPTRSFGNGWWWVE
ncbi:hypothetical protein [Microtetraspora glauca]|uniref:Uncharacterized protein n=1 Tax=Microtetraspora glauca TaxID=1996 RepID=A0ABV3GJ48_MICGL